MGSEMCIRDRYCTFVVDAKHKSASFGVQEGTDILGHGIWKVRVEVASSELELSTPGFHTHVLAPDIILQTAHLLPAVALPAQTETESN